MLERFLCIRPNERKNILFFSLLGFAWSISVCFGFAYSDALLIKAVGTQSLPLTYAITALGLFGFSGFFIYLYNRRPIHQVYYLWSAISTLFYTFIFMGLSVGIKSPYFFIGFKAFSYIIQIGFYSCFWTFIDQYFELQNAKRLFGIFYSAIFLGTAISGIVMALESSISQSSYLILAITTVPLIASAFLARYIHLNLEKLPDDFDQFIVYKTSARTLIKAIATSPFTMLLLLFCIFLQVLLLITEYEYMFGLQQYFQLEDGKGLTELLGKLYFFGGFFNIIFGIFIYGRVIKKAGLNNALLLVPLFFISLFCGWSFSSHLIMTIMGFIAVEGVMTLVEDNNFTLLLNAVPLKVKSKIRIVCESLIEPCGVLISSGLILVCKHHGKFLGLCLSIIMLGVGLLMRAYYTKGIFNNLTAHVINFKKPKHLWETNISKRDYHKSKQKFLQQFLSLKDKEQFFIFECSLRFNDLKFLQILMGKTTKLTTPVKLKVIQILSQYPRELSSEFLPYFQHWIKKDARLYKYLIFHLAKMNLIGIEQINKSTCPYMRASYALLLDHNERHQEAENILARMVFSKKQVEQHIAIEALRFLKRSNFNSILIELLKNRPESRETILTTLSKTVDQESHDLLPPLLSELDEETHIPFRYILVDCIEKIITPENLQEVLLQTTHWSDQEKRDLAEAITEMESPVTEPLAETLENNRHSDKIRLFAGSILSKVDKKQLKASFSQICGEEIERAYLYYYHFITIQKSYPYTNLNLLEQALKHSFDSIIDFIIQIQAHIQDFEEGDVLVQCLHSPTPKTVSHALETLQKMCPSKLYKKLLPIIEEGHDKHFFKSYHEQKLPILSLDELLDLLEHSSSIVNRMIVLSIKQRLNITPEIELPVDEKENLNQPEVQRL